MDYTKVLKNLKKDFDDMIIKEITLKNNKLTVINLETITSSDNINEFLLKKISYLENLNIKDLTSYLLNYLPVNNINIINNYKTLINRLLNGFTIIIINNTKLISIETRNNLTRGVSLIDYEKTIVGPKDAFIEHYNTNLGLIRKRIKSPNLYTKTYELGSYTKTKVSLVYLKGITKEKIINDISKKLNQITVDGVIDSNYLKKYLNNSNSFFPTLKSTERPDLASLSLLNGKAILIVDNSPEVLILPTFFIDFFHMSDDYYQKRLNITFVRLIRLTAFLLSIFLPSIYIALTTHNPDSMPINLLLSFQNQRQNVPFPAFLEATIMIITFEILRETDIRIPSSMGSSISILGGLVLGQAAVDAGLLSPIMIIVIAISAISSMLVQSIEAINAIRWYRFILIILASIFGYYGIFLGSILILTNLASIKSIDTDYLYPFAPINLQKQRDGFFKLKDNEKRGF